MSSNPRYPRQDEPYAAAFVVKSVLEGGATLDTAPSVAVRPTDGKLVWMLDEAAAAQLSGK